MAHTPSTPSAPTLESLDLEGTDSDRSASLRLNAVRELLGLVAAAQLPIPERLARAPEGKESQTLGLFIELIERDRLLREKTATIGLSDYLCNVLANIYEEIRAEGDVPGKAQEYAEFLAAHFALHGVPLSRNDALKLVLSSKKVAELRGPVEAAKRTVGRVFGVSERTMAKRRVESRSHVDVSYFGHEPPNVLARLDIVLQSLGFSNSARNKICALAEELRHTR